MAGTSIQNARTWSLQKTYCS